MSDRTIDRMTTMSRRRVNKLVTQLALGLLICLSAACNVDPYCLDCVDRDGGLVDGNGDGGKNGDAADAGPPADACVASGTEVCDGLDNDCDMQVDEGTLPMVGETCSNNVGACTMGIYACTAGELVCAGGVLATAEECNNVDDDCDGVVDNGDPGGGVVCGSDIGQCQKGITACQSGSVVCAGEVAPIAELCNLLDDDCDGAIDNDNPEGGTACGSTMGGCMPGTEQCIGGQVSCIGGQGPSFEICDGADNDCDGSIDETFDFNNDPNHCGDCTTVCTVANGQPGCSSMTCEIAFCFTGFWDLNTVYSDGCEYACSFAGAEVCNGVDDNCDGSTDEGLSPPNICSNIGECMGTTVACQDDGFGTTRWLCPYGSTVSTDSMGDIIPETDCDGLDNDCDGVADDAFPTLGDGCSRGIGSCTTTGNIVCNSTMDGIECSAATPPGGSPETCNGLDDDCDTMIDEQAPNNWVEIATDLWMYQYEASRPDATDTSAGTVITRACSEMNRLPWANVTRPEAEAACAAAGGTLCDEDDWQSACESMSGLCTWSFANMCTTYATDTCNGNDYDFDPGTPLINEDGVLPAGSLGMCVADFGSDGVVYDLSGNLKEWTLPRSAGVNPLRGGSYNNTAGGIQCDFDFAVANDTFQFQNVGFRCCYSGPPVPPF